MSYSNFNTFKLFENVGINSSGDYMVSMKPNDNNVSFHSSNSIDYNNVDIMSIKNIINKKQNEDLNLSSLTGTTINPVITINNNHSDCRIMTNLNVSGNLNVTQNLNVSGNINLTNSGMLKTTGIGSFGSINCGVGTFTSIDSTGLIKTTYQGSFGSIVTQGNIEPSVDNIHNLGSSSQGFANSYVNQGLFDKVVVKYNLDVGGNLNINGPAYVNAGSTNNAVRIIGSGHGDGAVGISWYENESTAIQGTQKAYIQAGTASGKSGTHSNMYLTCSNNIILTGNNVGIGSSNPNKTLDINGDITNNGILEFKYGDRGANLPTGNGDYRYNVNVVNAFPHIIENAYQHAGHNWRGRFYISMEVPKDKDATGRLDPLVRGEWYIGTIHNNHSDAYTYICFGQRNPADPHARNNNTNIRITGYIHSGFNNNNYTYFGKAMNFTGQHRCVPQNIDYYNNVDNYIGLIVYATGEYKTYSNFEEKLTTDKEAITINDSLPIIDLSNKKKQKSVFGIISEKEEEKRAYQAGVFHTPMPNINDDKRLYINSVGEGAIWIVNTNGNLENGDYIQASDVIGMGEKQDDDFLANYTVAKITCDCNFDTNSTKYNCVEFVDPTSGNTYKKAFVGCSYHCG